MAYYVLPSEEVGGHVPRVPHQNAQMSGVITILNEFLILWLLLNKTLR